MKIFQQSALGVMALLCFAMLPFSSFGQYHNDVLSYKYNGTPTNGIKINTNMPFQNSSQMPTLMLEGYDYGRGQAIDLKIVYYIYNGNYVSHSVTSTTNYKPDIYLSQENGNVVVYIDDRSYYNRFHIRAFGNMYEQDKWFTGWTASDAPLPVTQQNVKLPYKEKTISSSQTSLPISSSSNNVTQVYGPTGGTFYQNGVDVVGAIKVALPVLYTNTMLKIRVEVFNYLTDQSFTAIISGYNYAPSSTWYNCSAQIITSSLNNHHKVYFGDDGNKAAIWIGEADTEWRYLKVRVAEVQASHGSISENIWDKGWSVGLETANFSSMVNRTVSNTLPVSSGSSIWQQTAEGISYLEEDAKVGIGTNAPTAELTVKGDVHAKEVRVYTDAGADFVFEPDYKLPELEQLEAFVKKNKHLPDIAPEKAMIEDGLHLGEMNIRLLQKVEELTLYVIELNKKLKALEAK